MTIPTIDPYPMPAEPDLPSNRVPWRPDPARAALLIHDMQRYFVDYFPQRAAPVVQLTDNIRRIRGTAVELGMPVFYSAQPGGMTRQERGLLLDMWGPGMTDDPDGRRIIDELTPAADDTVVTKWRYSAFVRSDLERLLLEQDRDQLIIVGVYAHVGCLMTACDAFSRDIEPFLVADAIADFTPEYHRWALDYAAQRCAVVVSADAVLRQLADRVAAP